LSQGVDYSARASAARSTRSCLEIALAGADRLGRSAWTKRGVALPPGLLRDRRRTRGRL